MPSILIVEDSPVTIAMLKSQLEKYQAKTTIAQNITLALDALADATGPFDLIIADFNLEEDYDGLDFAKQLKYQTMHRKTPVIMFTARQDDLIKEKCDALGLAGCFTKDNSEAFGFKNAIAVILNKKNAA